MTHCAPPVSYHYHAVNVFIFAADFALLEKWFHIIVNLSLGCTPSAFLISDSVIVV